MKLITKEMPINFNLFCMGDVHEGTVLFYRSGFGQFVDMVHSEFEGLPAENNYIVHHGDGIEAITIDDKRYDPQLIDDPRGTPFVQAQKHIDHLRPVAKKIVVLLQGNHEAKLSKYGDLSQYMARELNVPYGTYSSKISYVTRSGNLMFKHFCTHGAKSITSTADDPKRRRVNMELILKRQLKHKAGDCLLESQGHTHKLLVCRPNPELYLTDNGEHVVQQYTHSHRAEGYIHPDHRWYASTGSFMKLYADGASGYAERFGYDPVELGFVVAIVRNRIIEEVRPIVLDR